MYEFQKWWKKYSHEGIWDYEEYFESGWDAAVEQHRWIPVSERLPEDDSPHLFWLESGNVIQGIPSCELGKHNPPLTHKATHWKSIILP